MDNFIHCLFLGLVWFLGKPHNGDSLSWALLGFPVDVWKDKARLRARLGTMVLKGVGTRLFQKASEV